MPVDAVVASQALALVAAHRWEIAALRSNFENAIRLNGEAAVYANYARALTDVNDMRGAFDLMEIAARKEPENLAYLRAAVNWSFCAGFWEKTTELYRMLDLRTDASGSEAAGLVELVELARVIGLRDETVQNTIACATQFLADRKVRVASFSHSAEYSPADESIYFRLLVPVGRARARALDDELTPILFDAVSDLQLDTFILTIESHPDHEPA